MTEREASRLTRDRISDAAEALEREANRYDAAMRALYDDAEAAEREEEAHQKKAWAILAELYDDSKFAEGAAWVAYGIATAGELTFDGARFVWALQMVEDGE